MIEESWKMVAVLQHTRYNIRTTVDWIKETIHEDDYFMDKSSNTHCQNIYFRNEEDALLFMLCADKNLCYKMVNSNDKTIINYQN